MPYLTSSRLQGLPTKSRIVFGIFSLLTVFTLHGHKVRLQQSEEQTAHLQTVLLHWFFSADPDTNRTAGLHSYFVVLSKQCHIRLVEFACLLV